MAPTSSATSPFKIQQLNHAQVLTSQITITEKFNKDINPDELESIKLSLEKHGINLIPLILRKLNEPIDEKILEIISGHEWFIVANELNVQRLWAWVFNLTDQEAVVIQNEMNRFSSNDSVSIELSQIKQSLNILRNQFSEYQIQIVEKFDEIIMRLPPPPPPKFSININTLTELEFKALKDKRQINGVSENAFSKIIKVRSRGKFSSLDDIRSGLLELDESPRNVTRIVNALSKYEIEFS